MADAAQRLIELAGAFRIDLDPGASFLWVASQASGEQSAQSLYSLEDEKDNLLCLGFIKKEVLADGFCIHDGPSQIGLLVVAYHRNDIGSILIRIGIGVATNAADLLGVVFLM